MRNMITIFFCPKPFTGKMSIIQRNAIKSWQSLSPRPEIILIGNEPGAKEICSEFSLIHIPEVDCNEFGTPLVSSIFEKAQNHASYDILCYINADIILTDGFIAAATLAMERNDKFLMIGRRYDVEINQELNFDKPDWTEKMKSLIKQNGVLHSPLAMDYFIFKRGVYSSVLPFAIGRASWDCWLVHWARNSKIPVIDASNRILAIHQNHEYSIEAVKNGDWNWDQGEMKRNFELSNGLFCSINNATHQIKNNRICKRRIYLWTEPVMLFVKNSTKKLKRYIKQALGGIFER